MTPKGGVSYKLNDDNMVYATAAKGFRIGGYNPRVGLPCTPQLASLGLTAAPQLFDSDSVWSYEVGSKNVLADGRVQLNTSVVDRNAIALAAAILVIQFVLHC